MSLIPICSLAHTQYPNKDKNLLILIISLRNKPHADKEKISPFLFCAICSPKPHADTNKKKPSCFSSLLRETDDSKIKLPI